MRRWLVERLTDLLVFDVEVCEKVLKGGAVMVERAWGRFR